jgi:dTMP kinase
MNKTGKFMVFEGGEGTGKTTQIKLLEQRLRDEGHLVYVTREPGGRGCSLGEKIRNILKDPENKNMVPEAELFLFLASRAQHVQNHIQPHLNLNYIVISDRYYGSTLAYQHYGRGLFDFDEILRLNSFATLGLEPDVTFFLDLEPQKGISRIGLKAENDRFDSAKLEFHEKVRNGYLDIAEKKAWQVINADDTIVGIHRNIWEKTKQIFFNVNDR